MVLFYRKKGETGEPLIILHGLYGSGDNWMSIAQELSSKYRVYLIDQRNHGRSPHAVDMSYDALTDDLNGFIEKHSPGKVNIIGHSMGGKAAMRFAQKHPGKAARLVVVDVSPGNYDMASPNSGTHKKIIHALKSVDPAVAGNRKDIERQLAKHIENVQLRMFLLKNIERTEDGTYRWRLNIGSIEKNIKTIMDSIPDIETPVPTPTLFLKGEQSSYITEKELPLIKKLFPNSRLVTIPNAGHWLHARQPKLFVKEVMGFLTEK